MPMMWLIRLDELDPGMVDLQPLAISNIDQDVVSEPVIGVNHAISTSPAKEEGCSEISANRSRITRRKQFTLLRIKLAYLAVLVVSKSMRKNFASFSEFGA
jgi:hypothetical protein